MADENKTMRDVALDSVPDNRREELIDRAHRIGAHHPEDMGWHLVENTVACREAAAQAAASAREVKASVDQLTEAINALPEKSSKAVLDAGDYARDRVQESLQGFAQEQANTMKASVREVIQNEYAAAEKDRRAHWKAMLDEFDSIADEVSINHVEQIKGDLTDAVNRLSKRDQVWSAVLTMLFGAMLIAFAGFGGVYLWNDYFNQSQPQQTLLRHCTHGNNGSIWCRIKP